MKDEYKGNLIKEFVGLRPKIYSNLEANGQEKKTAKGIVKKTSKKFVTVLILTLSTTKQALQ